MADGGALLEVRALAKSFGGVHAVVDCNLRVLPNTVVGLIGPNGAGKSTAIDLISGFRPPDAGTIVFDGREIQGWNAHRVAGTGLMRTFQTAREWKNLTVMDNMLAAAPMGGMDAMWRAFASRGRLRRFDHANRALARGLLEQFGLTKLTDDYAGTLSGGQKRLLEFARIVMSGARMVILDEPLAGVNPVLHTTMLDAVQQLRERNITCLVVEHNLSWIERACAEVYVMALGSTIGHGSMASLRRDRGVIDAYLGEVAESA
ncbi:MAG TPA: ATP-binding cassette domain-containing protein [Candidatus Dormibacteraeota bacterium]|nr:ATP-binding cassette domain-containing protein [Candidatus Dormibacteraeota bacterium]